MTGGPPTAHESTGRTGRVMIVDDHPVFRTGLAGLIRDAPDLNLCAETDTLRDARRLVDSEVPDLVVVDLALRDGSGLDLVKDIHRQSRAIRTLVVSMYEERFYAERALRAGADGYITKAEAAERIIDGIRTVLQGQVYLTGDWAERLLRRDPQGKPDAGEPEQVLTDRELEIFELIGRGLSTSEMASRLQRSPKTIDSHREHIKRKLGDIDNAALVQQAVVRFLQSSGSDREDG